MIQELFRKHLGRAELFARLDDNERENIAPLFQMRTLKRHEHLFEQGGERRAMFLILQGEIELVDESLGYEKIYAVCGPGTVLGDPILIEQGLHALEGRVIDSCEVAVLERSAIDKIKSEMPEVFTHLVMALSQLLARRLAYANRGDRGVGADFRGGETRSEHDLLGNRDVPNNVLWGVQTLRALENYSISGVRLDHFPDFIESFADIKFVCAEVNHRLGRLDQERKDAIQSACDEIRKGQWHAHFMVDMIQGGAGTSANMNANEVIANRALEILGRERGDYAYLHPNNHVNMSQSTNDVYPSAIKLTLLVMSEGLLAETKRLADSFHRKGDEFSRILKMGRTQLQDAVPMTLGQEFHAWAGIIREGGERIASGLDSSRALNMGGTAIGTGINAHPDYARAVVEELAKRTKLRLRLAENLVQGTQDTSAFVELAGVFKMMAVRLSKICNDLRLLSSGPRCGINEINLPPMAPGSSIMPGKVNPVIPEVVNQVAFQVVGLDTTVAMASEAGQLELNVFEPVIAYNLFSSIRMLQNAMRTLRQRCVDGITANEDVCSDMFHRSIGVVTALNPLLGYEKTSEVAREALQSGRAVYDIVLDKGYLKKEELDKALSPEAMIRPSETAVRRE